MDLAHDTVGHTSQGEEDPDIESLRLADKLDSSTARGAVVDKKVPSEEVHAFLDGVASQDDGVDMSLLQTGQSANATRGSKRQSDIVDVGSHSILTESTSSSAGSRTKRKR
jgi:hypothetical protein